jgi:hypothetical protein
MALPSSGPLSLADIQGEFGGSNPISLSEYYAGGGLVPSGTTGTYGAVPSSGTISIQNFYGTQKFSISGGSTFVDGSDTRLGAGSKTVTTSSASAGTIVGGTAPFSYLWEYVSGDTFSPNTSTSSSTTFSKNMTVSIGQTVTNTGVYRCRVTDSASNVIYGPNCTVETTLTETS